MNTPFRTQILLYMLACSFSMLGLTRTITLKEPGTLSLDYPFDDRKQEINLILQGAVDQRDIQYIRDSLLIGILDLSKTTFSAYKEHPANTFPQTDISGNTVDERIAQSRKCGVRKLILPNGIIALEDASCMGFNLSEGIVLPSSLKKIGESAFSFTRMKQIEIPRNVEIIEGDSFTLSTLEELRFERGSRLHQLGDPKLQLPIFYSGDPIQHIDLSNCKEFTRAIFPLAFHCNQLNRLILPESLTEISKHFVTMKHPVEIVIHAKTPPQVVGRRWESITLEWGKPSIVVPKESKAIYEQTEGWRKFTIKEM